MSPFLNKMLGFTNKEVKEIIKKVDLGVDDQELMQVLKENYNGYLFNQRGSERVYNPDMVLYFFNQWQMNGFYPQDLIDDNVKTDYGRLNRLTANQKNREVLEDIIQQEAITSDIITKFSFDRMYDNEYFVSLLFYMGLLTIKGTRYGKTRLGIPNYVTKEIFWDYFEKRLRDEFNIYLERDPRMPEVEYEWVLELKYLKESEKDSLEEVKEEGLRQLDKYVASREFSNEVKLKQALLIFVGKKEYYIIEKKSSGC